MTQVEKEGWYSALKSRYEEMIIKNEGNLILNGNRTKWQL